MPLLFEICCVNKASGCSVCVCWTMASGDMEENRERSWSQLEYVYIITMWVLCLIWSWLLYQWFCRCRILKAGFLMEHRGKLPLWLGSAIPLKASKLHCFDSLAEYSIFSPVLSPGDVLVKYLGLCDLVGWVSQWYFYADARNAIEWCTLTLSASLYSPLLTLGGDICKPVLLKVRFTELFPSHSLHLSVTHLHP